VFRWLKDAQPEVAAQCALESGDEIDDRDALFRELHDAWLPRLTDAEQEPQPGARATIGRALGRLDLDDRQGVGLDANGLPDIDWVTIPGGEFIYQDGERRWTEPFRIARYPVSNAQFRAFLEADDGYRDDRWWRDLTRPDRNAVRPRWDIPNHPRETVSWFEAMAFCAWLSHKSGLEVRLPTEWEWEWERAARGTHGRMYPWGSEYEAGRANIAETMDDAGPHYLARTSAVGIYPQGSSPEGLLDLSGNVWEWCLNEYDYPDRIQAGGSVPRVLRGGSWGDARGVAHADGRRGDHPDYRGGGGGCRLVCTSPIR
jgi:formylglycine-generating enzyme required for sulfatase activity